MLKLGDYDEDGSKAVAECLKKAGVRVELKPSIGASLETEDLLQGRLSELKAIIKDKELLEEYDEIPRCPEKDPGAEGFSGGF